MNLVGVVRLMQTARNGDFIEQQKAKIQKEVAQVLEEFEQEHVTITQKIFDVVGKMLVIDQKEMEQLRALGNEKSREARLLQDTLKSLEKAIEEGKGALARNQAVVSSYSTSMEDLRKQLASVPPEQAHKVLDRSIQDLGRKITHKVTYDNQSA